ncbi:DUF2809 domain-containing protein [Hymenobacter sp. UYP22]|uniref:ribosomal maturation YjgA family protein n=1 Tax=Hymenobacter sp. UYP22 TaxID=3156348 RepID=UPI00339088E0
MPARSRIFYALLSLLTVVLGLASRRYGAGLPGWVAAYAGDVLWALLVFWLLGWCRPRQPGRWVANWALLLAFGVEFSQLFHPPWLDALRYTTLGGLVLGRGFLWSDLLCYTLGVAVGTKLEQLWAGRGKAPGF